MKINLLVLFGGKSTEHEVSIITASQAMENMDKEKYEIYPVYMSKDGDFYYDKTLLLDVKNFKDEKKLFNKLTKVNFVKEKNKTYLIESKNKIIGTNKICTIDVAFPIVHGTNVEDGSLQGYLHTLNLPVVGPNTIGGALSMDKYIMKQVLKAEGLPVLDAKKYSINEYKNTDLISDIEKNFSYPVIVKPINLGSSIGINKAKDREGLMKALELGFNFSKYVLIERAITNLREINCAVLGNNDEQIVSVLEEPLYNDDILSFTDKYLGGGKGAKGGVKTGIKSSAKTATGTKSSGMASLSRKVPADIDKDKEKLIKKLAIDTFKILNLSGVSRIDFMIDVDLDKVYINEINAIPGSLSYYLYDPLGISFKELIDRLIKIAIDEKRKEDNLLFSFESNLLK